MSRVADRGAVERSDSDQHLLVDQITALIDREAGTWRVEQGDFWCYVTPKGALRRPQGWKLHVSATPLAAPLVLARAAELLVRAGCAFKFAATLERVELLVSARYDRGGAGKFITVYPADDDEFAALAAALHEATLGLPGPQILSDRPYRSGSLVHYRYGGMSAAAVLSNDGTYEGMLTAPDGSQVKDQREPRFHTPAWAPPVPLPAAEPAPAVEARPAAGGGAKPVLLADRFVVREAIRHANRGGVYRALDQHSGADVVIKQARPHVAAVMSGQDCRDLLRHEAAILTRLAPKGHTPALVTLFEVNGHVFLAQELIAGQPLRAWVADRLPATDALGLPLTDTLRLAGAMVDIIAAIHAEGLVVRDFTPNNLIVTDDGDLRLVDLELACEPGTLTVRASTPGYGAPEQSHGSRIALAPTQAADRYGLGSTLVFLATGVDPAVPNGDDDAGRHRALLERLAADHPTLQALLPLVLALVDPDPAGRWELDQVRAFLAAARPAGHTMPGPPPTCVDRDRMLADGLEHLMQTMAPVNAPRLWRSGAFGERTDPCNVQHGAAGVLAVLARAAHAHDNGRLRDTLRDAAAWTVRRVGYEPRILPGLYFGRAGTAWALHEAAVALDDERLAETARRIACQLPLRWPNPDVCHGAAGAGMTQLYFLQATGQERFADRVRECADGLVAAAQRDPDGGVRWPIPATFASELAGLSHYGFAHGVAGVGNFLLDAGVTLGDDRYVAVARAAGDTLAAAADSADGATWWPSGEETADGPPARLVNWCSGASGVGTFLVRLWLATGEQHIRELAETAAMAVHRSRWHGPPVACHGVAGNAEFLLDLAAATGASGYRSWAEDLVAAAYARQTVRGGRIVVPDESMSEVTADYGTGLAGMLALLLRLRHGGTRLWMPDRLAVTTEAVTG